MSPNERNYSGLGENKAVFTINGKVHVVSDNVPAHTSLNTYIRDYAELKGTKFMCREGGCGVCVVTLTYEHPVTKKIVNMAVNSCLFPVFACHGLAVCTIEGIGNKKSGYDKVQSRLAHFSGTQCGFCSPGMVMTIHSMLKDNPTPSMQEAETGLDGNICRCTGYRPILDTSKSFAANVSDYLQRKVADIEDLLKICPKSGIQCHGKCEKPTCERAPYDCVEKEEDEEEDYESKFVELALSSTSLRMKLQASGMWYKVSTVKEIFEIFDMVSGTYQLVAGNTSRGVYKYEPYPDVFIDINNVAELKGHTFDGTNLTLGANMTLTEAIQLLSAVAQEKPGTFGYTQVIADHIKRVANTPVRNAGTLAGNLSIKHQHREFPSDIFLTLETVGATVTINSGVNEVTMPLLQYFETDMNKKVMTGINLQPLDHMYIIKTYKITPRSLNAKAEVNAGFCFKVDRFNRFRVLELPNIVYGNINPTFGHASSTESYLRDKFLMDLPTLQGALQLLSQEVKPDNRQPDGSPEYRLGLVQSLFYKFVLSINPDAINPRYRSGGNNLVRPLSSGKQEFETDPTMFPLGMPTPKLEAMVQCSGEAEYTQDIPIRKDTLFGALAMAPHGPGLLDSIDPSAALKVAGVVAFFSAKDIPGVNSFTSQHLLVPELEELFASVNVAYAGQPVGIIVAETQEIADNAAKLVVVNYKLKQKPLLDVRDVLKSGDLSRILLTGTIVPTAIKHDVKFKLNGSIHLAGQYHFTMETHCCLTVPIEDGLDVFCSTQWMQQSHEAIAFALNVPENSINMRVRRVGGGFGCKLTRANQPIVACSLAAYLLQKPVRIVLPIETNMKSTGLRYPNYTEYEAGVNDDGVIQYLMASVYEDDGVALNDPVVPILVIPAFPQIYDSSTWTVNAYDVRTDKATTCWMRGPGTLEAGAIVEHIMEHIAAVVKKDPLQVKLNNTIPGKYPIADMIAYAKLRSDYDLRLLAVKAYNEANLWKKKGIAFLATRFPLTYSARYHATVSIYRRDGTVAITHGGIEMGQGINTKAAQAAAHMLGCGLEKVVVKPSNNLTAPDSEFTGNSLSSESVVLAVIKCCKIILDRLDPVKAVMTSPTWEELIAKAFDMYVNLFACEMMSPPADKLVKYDVFGVTVIEIELDVLTGEYQVVRADVLEDTGRSFNPTVDIGQVEGAFVMGLGYFTSEELKYDPESGWLLTDRTWTYKVPVATDIPIDFRVYLKKNEGNPLGILRSKAVGEPPILMTCAVMSALRHAITSAREDLGFNNWFELDGPITREKVFLTCKSNRNNYVL